MQSVQTTTNSKKKTWTGRICSGIPVLFLLLDGVIKLFTPAPVVEVMTRLGYPIGLSVTLGVVLLICVFFYAIPRTSLLGAVLLTGYLGGAVATHLRVGDPLFSHTLFPIYIAGLIWAGLYLRQERLRTLVLCG